ncbi:phosphate signaling complex protein PhoU [candidate division KSB1 bacterium]|nr:phosphate signaling complex protein PhoU [candidate division KSB1 bacterium]
MTIQLEREIDKLKQKILSLGTMVEESLYLAMQSLEDRDEAAAQKVMESDQNIDDMEVDLEEECLKLLALHQPVAADLRFIIAVLKINNDLERIGDLAVNIAERSQYLATQPESGIPLNFGLMAEKVQIMLKKSLDALVNMDGTLAFEVTASDDEVDAMNRDMYKRITQAICDTQGNPGALIHRLSISRHLERIADQATNIAEDVIYMIEGRIVRHKTEDYRQTKDLKGFKNL